MGEEPADGGLQIKRDILMNDIVRKPLCRQFAEVTVPVVRDNGDGQRTQIFKQRNNG